MKIGIIGLGYVGLPLAVAFAEAGHEVVGLDADTRKVEALSAASPTSRTSPSASGAAARSPARDHRLRGARSVRSGLICVPTPLTATREPDLR